MVSSKGNSILSGFSNFSLGLKNYEAYRVISATKGITTKQTREMMSLRERLVREAGKFGPLVTELTGKEKIRTVGKGDEYSYDMWAAALRIEFNKTTLDALRICIDYTDRAVGKLEDDIDKGRRDEKGNLIKIETEKIASSSAESPLDIFDAMCLNYRVIEASRGLFKDKYYAQAIFEAFKAVNNFVKEKAVLALDGRDLMAKVFNENAPIIKLNDLLTLSDKDEQEGFKFLYMGAMVGIRNPKAHDNVIQTAPYRTLEYLSLASLLMKRVEEGKVSTLQKGKDV